MAMSEEERRCPECGETVSGRSDKVFCTKRCGTAAWNRTHRDRKNELHRQWRKRNRESLRDRGKKYYKEHKDSRAEYAKKYAQRNKDRLTAYYAQYFQANKEHKYAFNKVYRQKNRESINAKARVRENKYRKEMSDSYVRRVLCDSNNLTPKNIPQSLIDAKREHLRNLRFIKEQENE